MGTRPGPAVLAAVTLVAVAGIATTAAPADRAVPAASGLTGQLLVATPDLRDPRFVETVIYVVQHDPSGAMGIVVNRPLARVPLVRVLGELGLDPTGVSGDIRVHYGGPVDAARGVVLHTPDYAAKDTLRVNDKVSVTWAPEILRAIAAGQGPRRSLFALGYAGWGPGQLDAELDAGAWITVPADDDLVFGADYATKWQRAVGRRVIRL